MRFPQGMELVILLLVVLVLFGSKRLPDAARGLGRSLRIFKAEVNEMRDDEPKGSETGRDHKDQPLPPAESDAPGTADEPEGSRPSRQQGEG